MHELARRGRRVGVSAQHGSTTCHRSYAVSREIASDMSEHRYLVSALDSEAVVAWLVQKQTALSLTEHSLVHG